MRIVKRIGVVLVLASAGVSATATAQVAGAPASPHGALAVPCADCHSPDGWKPARISDRFNHGSTGFVLEGGHAAASCLSCHTSLDFQGVGATCASCHQDVHLGQLGAPCADCHTPRSFSDPARMARRHQLGRFPLEGPHLALACAQCHRPGSQGVRQYANLPTECSECHQAAFAATTNPDHVAAAFPRNCLNCHAPGTWAGGRFDHATTAYPLVGAHAAATCRDCHANGTYKGRDQTCMACHVEAFNATTNPPHQQARFPADCTMCHTGPTTWTGATFDHDAGGFPLVGAHRAVTCESCHVGGVWVGQSAACAACHQAKYDATVSPNHRAAAFALTCTDCHTQAAWAGAVFDHGTTDFPLTGAHLPVRCADCHADGVYGGRSMACFSCHQPDYDAVKAPDHRAASLPTDCTQCHTTGGFSGAAFDHGITAFPLTGAHLATGCLDCHADGVYTGRSMACLSCHQPDYTTTTAPPHQALTFPSDCTLCHSTSEWAGGVFNHTTTQFPLTGAHLASTCADCHAGGVYRGLSATCFSCHQQEYAATSAPNHQATGLPTDCVQCHGTAGWAGGGFDHATTQFPLTGAHLATSCLDCHGDGVYAGKATTCVSCHQPAYAGTTAPPHQALTFPTDCTQCHSTSGWAGGAFNHTTTPFPLTGAHLATSCADCHAGGVYRGLGTTCFTCHQPDYDATVQPDHRAAALPTDCTLCHSTGAWGNTLFNHSSTQFPLTGAHVQAPCASCHVNNTYAGTPTTCASCHLADYTATTAPNHQASGLPTDCVQCHGTAAWAGAGFNHATTQFPLTGAHLATTCLECHGDGVYRGKPTACVSCHQATYTGTTAPNHQAAGFPTDCAACHTTVRWPGAVFDHDATQFALTGAHRAVTCQDCHADGVYRGKPTACMTCHQPDYAATTAPPHLSLSFPADCTQCHTTTAWPGGTYNHATTSFPLTGAHIPTPCASCHVGGVYRGTPATCVACHQSDYNATTNPRHSTAMFPTTCTSCHSTATWIGAQFNHDAQYFPIYSGAHRNRWSTCADCHTNNQNYAVFTCLSCHEHNKTSMDSKHRGRNGYSYTSTACYSCHPRGTH